MGREESSQNDDVAKPPNVPFVSSPRAEKQKIKDGKQTKKDNGLQLSDVGEGPPAPTSGEDGVVVADEEPAIVAAFSTPTQQQEQHSINNHQTDSSLGGGTQPQQQEPILQAYLPVPKKKPLVVDGIVEQEHGNSGSLSSRKKNLLFLVGLVFVVLAISLPVCVILASRRNQRDNNTSSLSPSPTGAPSDSPLPPTVPPTNPPTSTRFDEVLEELERLYPNGTFAEYASAPWTPQYKAVQWLADQDTWFREFPLLGGEEEVGMNASDASGGGGKDHINHFLERYVMTVLYYSTNNNNSWYTDCGFLDASKHVCDWNCQFAPEIDEYGIPAVGDIMGVTCTTKGDLFTSDLELIFNGLQGTIPTELGMLANLRGVNFGYNSLSGTVPFTSFSTKTLQYLIVTWNEFLYGTIPSMIGEFESLVLLGLFSNQMSGTLPSEIGHMSNLIMLDLKYNNLNGTIPESLFEMDSMEYLYLENNSLTGIIPEISPRNNTGSNSSTLRSLHLYDNFLTGTIPTTIGFFLPGLYDFSLGGNYISGVVPSSLSAMSALDWIVFYDNMLTGKLFQEDFLYDITSLTSLHISGNFLSGTIDDKISNLTNLLDFNFAINNVTGSLPSSLETMTALGSLFGHTNRLTGTIPSLIGNIQGLEYLYLSLNDLEGSIPSEIGNLTLLRTLAVSENRLTGSIPSSLWEMTQLETLYLSLNDLTGTLNPLCESSPGEFYSDCFGEVECSCCLYCCDTSGECGPNTA